MPANDDARAGRAAFTHPGFVLFQVARFLIVAAVEMQAVAVGWQVYEITKRPLDLGYVGLAQFLPGILLFPISGHTSDRYQRSKVLSACYAGYAVCFALLLILSERGMPSIRSIYLVLILIGIVRSFNSTASRSILPQLVPTEHFPNAVAWNATIFQAATILGPSFGGIVYAAFHGPSAVYVIATVTAIGATISSFRIKPEVKARPARAHDRKDSVRRTALHMEQEADFGRDLAGSLRGTARRRGCVAAGVRERNPAHRTVGAGIVTHGSGSGRGGDGGASGASTVARKIWTYAALGGRRIRRLHDHLRTVAQPYAFV